MSSTSRIKEFVVEGFRKRVHPSKHYVYDIRVINTDGSSFLIQRRFTHFFKLQKQLEKLFPTEAGCIYQNERTLPFLPSNVGIAKHHTRAASEKRMLPLQDYCQRLIGLPPEISQCSQVLNFFSQTEDDQRLRDISELDEPEIDIEKVTMIRTTSQPSSAIYRVVEDFTARGDNQVNITENEHVEVIEKLETGWWFVKCYNGRGWVPAVLLEAVDGHQEDQTKIYAALGFLGGKEYIAARSYEAQEEDELSFIKGDVMRVLEKRIEGWWLATFSEGRGLVPGNYLKRVNKASAIRLQRDPTIIRRLKGCRTLAARFDDSLSASSDEETESVTSKEAPPRTGRANRPIPPKKPEKRAEKAEEKCYYRSLYDSDGAVNGGVNMKVGQLVEVITKSEGGWWVVRVGGQEGWAPSAHLVPNDSTQSSTETNNIRNVKDAREDVNKPTSNPARQEDCNIHYYAPTVLYNDQPGNERGGSSGDEGDEMFWTRNPEEGERFMKSIGQEGTYFIRKSQKSPNNLTLVVSGGDKTNYKYKILHDEANRRYQMLKREFGSLTEIIAFYKSHNLPKIALRLKRPITSYNVQPFNR